MFKTCIVYFLIMTYVIINEASYCGKYGVPYSFEVLSTGAPVLGCAQPSCIIVPEETFVEDSEFLSDVNGQPDGYFRNNDRNPKRYRTNNSSKFAINCSGGIEYIDHPRQPLVLQCCTYEGLRFSQEVGSTIVGPGEAITGGEVIRNGRQISFDIISNVKKVIKNGSVFSASKITYEVTVRRMNCLPNPPESEIQYEKDIVNEISKVLSSAANKDLGTIEKFKKKFQFKNEKKLKTEQAINYVSPTTSNASIQNFNNYNNPVQSQQSLLQPTFQQSLQQPAQQPFLQPTLQQSLQQPAQQPFLQPTLQQSLQQPAQQPIFQPTLQQSLQQPVQQAFLQQQPYPSQFSSQQVQFLPSQQQNFPQQNFPQQNFPQQNFQQQNFQQQNLQQQTLHQQNLQQQNLQRQNYQQQPNAELSRVENHLITTTSFPIFPTFHTFPLFGSFPTLPPHSFPTLLTHTFPTHTFPTHTFPTFPTFAPIGITAAPVRNEITAGPYPVVENTYIRNESFTDFSNSSQTIDNNVRRVPVFSFAAPSFSLSGIPTSHLAPLSPIFSSHPPSSSFNTFQSDSNTPILSARQYEQNYQPQTISEPLSHVRNPSNQLLMPSLIQTPTLTENNGYLNSRPNVNLPAQPQELTQSLSESRKTFDASSAPSAAPPGALPAALPGALPAAPPAGFPAIPPAALPGTLLSVPAYGTPISPLIPPAMGTILEALQGPVRPISVPGLGIIGYSNAPGSRK